MFVLGLVVICKRGEIVGKGSGCRNPESRNRGFSNSEEVGDNFLLAPDLGGRDQ